MRGWELPQNNPSGTTQKNLGGKTITMDYGVTRNDTGTVEDQMAGYRAQQETGAQVWNKAANRGATPEQMRAYYEQANAATAGAKSGGVNPDSALGARLASGQGGPGGGNKFHSRSDQGNDSRRGGGSYEQSIMDKQKQGQKDSLSFLSSAGY